MRNAVLLGLLALVGCTKSSPSATASAADRVELEIPAPAREADRHVLEAVQRTTIPVGVFVLSLSTSSRFGCSRSWQTSSTTAKAKLELGDGFATLEVKEETSTISGSHGMPGPPIQSHNSTSTRLRGSFSEVGPGKLQASLTPVSCEGGCTSGAVEVVCELKRIPLDERNPSESVGADAAVGAGGSIDGIVCAGLDGVFDSRIEGDLPLAAGAGVEVDRTSYGYGSGTSKTFRAVAAVTP